MAEIKIEKKTPIWPWILLAVAVIVVLFLVLSNNDDSEKVEDIQDDRIEQGFGGSTDVRRAVINNSAVFAFVSFINEDPDSMGLDHEFTNEALLKLTNATSALADEIDYDIQKDLDKVKTHADKITKDPFDTTHANSIRMSAGILANVLQNIQQKAFPNLESEADVVIKSASAIELEALTLNQKGDIKNFFRKSADLLEKMNNNSPQI
ncbi:hypothetical protein [Belliella aquatica]|uniref:Uncharacterized protein n=1 Tax=Belliella aquatica TaxID=1323734 RepID=A0ABQ1LLY9_9BACT|nr:hypothetical protein [Belliella aquatica]MCH7404279.1 hypothetical protein [Belliella aquatica]GGC26783.1 hypothetical protein GCM10010993_02270 [Belliella aquatica]